jgi:hypothetical protein
VIAHVHEENQVYEKPHQPGDESAHLDARWLNFRVSSSKMFENEAAIFKRKREE